MLDMFAYTLKFHNINTSANTLRGGREPPPEIASQLGLCLD